jgi:DNA-binding NtrC family response regulator
MSQPAAEAVPVTTILIIDDEAAVRNVTRTLLERAGYRVLTASGGTEGVAAFAAEREAIDLVILDLTMPQMSGREVLAELMRLRATVKVILSSGYNNADTAPVAPNVAGFLNKPFRFDELLRVVRAGLAVQL